jgi:hypothetical protein
MTFSSVSGSGPGAESTVIEDLLRVWPELVQLKTAGYELAPVHGRQHLTGGLIDEATSKAADLPYPV